MSELANNKSIRKEVQDLGETLGITPKGKNNQQKIRSIGEQASDGTYATKEYVNTLMSGALKRQIVETLPTENIDTNTIYMVLDQSASQQGNVYNEYLYINNAWELIGTTATSGGGVTLYQHNILVEEFVQAQVLTTSATPFTLATFIQWLGNNQYPCNGMAHEMSEEGIYGNTLYLFVDNNLLATYLYDKPESGNTWNYNFNDNADLVFDDTVIQIQ